MKNTLYLVGFFGDYGFHCYTSPYNPTRNIDEAKGILKKAVVENYSDAQYKIYPIIVDDDNVLNDSLGDYKTLRDKTQQLLQNYEWYDSLVDSAGLYFENNLAYNEKTKTVTVKIKTILCRGYVSPKDQPGFRERWKQELIERVEVAYIPEIRKILDSENLDMRVEFKLNGKKLIKGYITKTTNK